LAVGIENRFFGKSIPTTDMRTENLQYLTISQTLADIASFKKVLQAQFNLTASNKWISFGGSYAGALSAWLRQEYPDKFYAAYASSAPIALEQNFYEYDEVVALAVRKSSFKCLQNVYKAFNQMKALVPTSNGRTTLSKLFKYDLGFFHKDLMVDKKKQIGYNFFYKF
jgi:pimeloyl-ACP methyl ester carboxylesterase